MMDSRGDEFRGIKDGTRGAAWHKGAVVLVGAVEEAFGEEGDTVAAAGGFDRATGKAHGGDPWKPAGEELDEGFGGVGVFLGVVVERAVEFDVGERDGGRRSGSEGGEPGDLGFHESGEFQGRNVNGTAAEVAGLARMRAQVQAVGRGEGDHAAHGVVVAGVTAAGDVHALDDGAECRGESGWFVLAEVAVEVEVGHGGRGRSVRSDGSV
jgi:hypothetical protein